MHGDLGVESEGEGCGPCWYSEVAAIGFKLVLSLLVFLKGFMQCL